MARVLRGVGFTAACAGAVLIGAPGSARATDSNWTVTAGIAQSGRNVAFAALADNIEFSGNRGHVMDCTQVFMGLNAIVGTHLAPNHLIRVPGKSVSAGNCQLTFVDAPMSMSASGRWGISALHGGGGIEYMGLAKIFMRFASADPDYLCSFDLAGSNKIAYDDNSHQLYDDSAQTLLRVSNVTGCMGARLSNDNRLGLFNFKFKVKAKNSTDLDPLQITGF